MRHRTGQDCVAQPGCASGSPDACVIQSGILYGFRTTSARKNAMWNSYKLQWENHSGQVLEQGQSLAAENDVGLGKGKVIMQNERTWEFPL